jgi:prepilin-type N-terminal cleavage/methylation domain-containing protein
MDRLMRLLERLRRRLATRSGFTLIEVMVALGILATGLLTVAAAQVHAMRGGTSGKHGSDAASIANSQIENFQRAAFATLNPTAGWAPAGGQQVQRTVQTDPVDLLEMTYVVQWRITDVTPDLKAIDVRVTWAEPSRPNRDVTISTMRHNDPLTAGGV